MPQVLYMGVDFFVIQSCIVGLEVKSDDCFSNSQHPRGILLVSIAPVLGHPMPSSGHVIHIYILVGQTPILVKFKVT